jgi:hypothetical protein
MWIGDAQIPKQRIVLEQHAGVAAAHRHVIELP